MSSLVPWFLVFPNLAARVIRLTIGTVLTISPQLSSPSLESLQVLKDHYGISSFVFPWCPTLSVPVENLTNSKCIRHLHGPVLFFVHLCFLNIVSFHSSLPVCLSVSLSHWAMLECMWLLSIKGMWVELVCVNSVPWQVNNDGICWHFSLVKQGTGSRCSNWS